MKVRIAIGWSESLKDKRRVVRSLKDTLHRHHQVSVAEVEDQQILNRATLGVSLTGTDGGHVGSVLDRVLDRIRSGHDCEVTGAEREILHGWIGSYASGSSGAEPDDEEDTLADEMMRRGLDAVESVARTTRIPGKEGA